MPWNRDRIPAILKVIKESKHNIKIRDIHRFLFKNKKNYSIFKDNLKNYLTQCNLEEANYIFKKKILKIKKKILIIGTADNYHHFLIPKTIKSLRSKGIFVAGILGDDEFNYKRYRFLVGWFDLYVVYVKKCLKYYEKFKLTKGYYLPNSCYIDGNKFKKKTVFDVILIGAPFGNRPKIVKAIIDAKINIGIYGSPNWKNYPYAKNYYYGFVPSEKFDEILSRSKIILALLENHIDGKLHMNTKIWEAVRVSRLPISTYYKPLFNDYGFKEGIDIVTYKSINDLVQKIKFYSKNDKNRDLIIEKLYNKVNKNFNYDILYSSFFNKIVDYFSKKKKILNFDEIKPKVFNNIVKGTDISKASITELDDEIYNHLKIISKTKLHKKINIISYDSIEDGQRVLNRWPFVNLNNMIFLKKYNNRLSYILLILLSFMSGKFLHIRQFCLVRDKKSFTGYLNLFLDKILQNKILTVIRKKLKI